MESTLSGSFVFIHGENMLNENFKSPSTAICRHITKKVLPYVYKCTHKTSGKFYFGFRSANTLPPELDFPRYKTSSTKVNGKFSEFNWEIIAVFFTKEDAYDFEQQLINDYREDPNIINTMCLFNKIRFLTVNKVSVKDEFGNTSSVFKDDERLKTKELVPVNTGLTVVLDKNGNKIKVNKNDPRIESGEFQRFQTGRKWMNNGFEMRLIDSDKIDEFKQNGFEMGKLPQHNVDLDKRVWMNKESINKRVRESLIGTHIQDGWIRGRISATV
jgi:hypothetical protein